MGLTASAIRRPRVIGRRPLIWGRAARDGAIIAGVVWVFAQALGIVGPFTDAHAYWTTDLDALYARPVGSTDSYTYAPLIAQVMAPLTALPWAVFAGFWAALLFGALVWLTGNWLPLAIMAPPVAFELYAGNIHILLAAAIVLGWRHPAAWSYLLVTKITPGVGLLWFAVRREWRPLGIALGITAGLVAVSFALGPNLWFQWSDFLLATSHPTQPTALPIPLAFRILPAAALVVWGARTNRPWTVPVGALLALPVLWAGSLAMLLALLARPGTKYGLERRRQVSFGAYRGPERRATAPGIA